MATASLGSASDMVHVWDSVDLDRYIPPSPSCSVMTTSSRGWTPAASQHFESQIELQMPTLVLDEEVAFPSTVRHHESYRRVQDGFAFNGDAFSARPDLSCLPDLLARGVHWTGQVKHATIFRNDIVQTSHRYGCSQSSENYSTSRASLTKLSTTLTLSKRECGQELRRRAAAAGKMANFAAVQPIGFLALGFQGVPSNLYRLPRLHASTAAVAAPSETEADTHLVDITMTSCQRATCQSPTSGRLQLSADFIARVAQLPVPLRANSSTMRTDTAGDINLAYDAFIDKFGTHYISSAELGQLEWSGSPSQPLDVVEQDSTTTSAPRTWLFLPRANVVCGSTSPASSSNPHAVVCFEAKPIADLLDQAALNGFQYAIAETTFPRLGGGSILSDAWSFTEADLAAVRTFLEQRIEARTQSDVGAGLLASPSLTSRRLEEEVRRSYWIKSRLAHFDWLASVIRSGSVDKKVWPAVPTNATTQRAGERTRAELFYKEGLYALRFEDNFAAFIEVWACLTASSPLQRSSLTEDSSQEELLWAKLPLETRGPSTFLVAKASHVEASMLLTNIPPPAEVVLQDEEGYAAWKNSLLSDELGYQERLTRLDSHTADLGHILARRTYLD